jgi:hypothetical protein
MNTTPRHVRGLLAILLLAACAWAGDPWKSKPYMQWDEAEVNRILLDSPWSKSISNVGGTMKLNTEANLSNSGAVLGSNGIGGGVGNPGEFDPLADPRAPKSYVVEWFSSRTVREAAARESMIKGNITAGQVEKQLEAAIPDYQIMIRGADMSIFTSRAEDSFMDKAFLQIIPSNGKISPSRVEYLRNASGHVYAAIFHFPRTNAAGAPAISASVKRVDFYCHIGDGVVRAGFEPAKMTDSQGLDL